MYEDLVKRLRYCSEEHGGCGVCELSDNCVLRAGLLLQAADAIEELRLTAESYKRSMEAWVIWTQLKQKSGKKQMSNFASTLYMLLPPSSRQRMASDGASLR